MHRAGRAALAATLLCGLLIALAGTRTPAGAQDQNRALSFSDLDFNSLILSTVQIAACDKARPATMPTIDLATFQKTCRSGWVGSGTIIRPDGTVLTNAHVALSEDQKEPVWALVQRTVDAHSPSQPAWFGRAVLYSPAGFGPRTFGGTNLDLAVVVPAFALDGTPITPGSIVARPLPMADAGSVDIGDELRNIGYPPVIGGDLITITQGNVSGFEQDPFVKQLGGNGWIKTDATLGGGISGGTSINADGQLIGVPTEMGGAEVRPVANADQTGTIQSVIGQLNRLRPIPEGFTLLADVGLGEGLPAEANAAPAADPDEVILTGSILSADTDRPIGGAWFIILEPGVSTADYLNGRQDVVYTFASSGSDGAFQVKKPVTRGQAYGVVVIARGFSTIAEDNRVLAPADAPAVTSLPAVRMAAQR